MLEVSKQVMDTVTVVANSEAAWEMGTRVCCYRKEEMPADQVMICNRTEKGSVERCKVVDAQALVVPVTLAPAPASGRKRQATGKHRGSKRGSTHHKVAVKAKGIAPPKVAVKAWTVWVWEDNARGGRWKGTGVRMDYGPACMHACTLKAEDGVDRALALHVSSGRPDRALWAVKEAVKEEVKAEVEGGRLKAEPEGGMVQMGRSYAEQVAKLKRDNLVLRSRLADLRPHGADHCALCNVDLAMLDADTGKVWCEDCRILVDETRPIAAHVADTIRQALVAQ